jgi:TfoX/Sxy family transcriptional regulator of competence genes
MAYDEALADRVTAIIGARDHVTERRMFGGITWLVQGNMACGVLGDELAVRLGEEDAQDALGEPHTRPFAMGGASRTARGSILVAGDAVTGDEDLARWVDAGADHAASLPAK